jgi:hypothetical protein
MARALDEDELVGHWTLLNEEMELLSGRRGPTKLAFALMLKFHQLHGRFTRVASCRTRPSSTSPLR